MDVNANSVAEKASLRGANITRFGITISDVIQKINGKPVSSAKSLLSELDNHNVGDSVSIGIIREGEVLTVEAVLD